MSTRYFETVTSKSVYEIKLEFEFPSSNDAALSIDDLQPSGSNWGRRQLFACQVIISPTAAQVLPAYKQYTRIERPQETQEIQDFLDGPDTDLMHHSTHFLMGEYGETLGELWGALASVKHYPRPIPRNDGTPEAKRARRGVVHTGYVHSAGIQVSSSNPEDRNHSSPGGSEGSTGYTETKPTQELPAEDNALHLINRVLRHLLYYTQPLNASPVLDLRQKCRMVSQISELKKQFVAVDDGGLILRVEGGVSTGPHIAIALLEAKRRLVVDDNKPRISDECLAQMTCEAILARAIPAEEQLGNERTIVLNATSHYVCFLEFNVTKAYMRRLMAGQLPSESLKVTATHWFDLSAVEGRRGVLNNIRGLLGMAMDRQPQQDVISDSEGVED